MCSPRCFPIVDAFGYSSMSVRALGLSFGAGSGARSTSHRNTVLTSPSSFHYRSLARESHSSLVPHAPHLAVLLHPSSAPLVAFARPRAFHHQ